MLKDKHEGEKIQQRKKKTFQKINMLPVTKVHREKIHKPQSAKRVKKTTSDQISKSSYRPHITGASSMLAGQVYSGARWIRQQSAGNAKNVCRRLLTVEDSRTDGESSPHMKRRPQRSRHSQTYIYIYI